MKRIIIVLLMIGTFLYAEKVEIQADKFEADEMKLISLFTGHVIIKKGKDRIEADRVTIHFTPKKKPKRYTASGHVRFEILTRTQHYKGSSDTLSYLPANQQYEADGNVVIEELKSGKKLYGEKIVIDRKSGKSEITGKKNRPVKLIFSVEEK
ncbi:MAG: lipopolysaccharide transport periplasmic protein LptA [Campylobacteraceae bacterium 4484_4]|nr:MAG: lipopolysaccharide transport periplasmic protein LptA [Campylobacteraceae bacterium 4484_4]